MIGSFSGQDFAIRTISMETVIGCVFFLFSKASKFKTSMARVPYNKLPTNPIGPQSFLYGARLIAAQQQQQQSIFATTITRFMRML